MSLKRVLVVDDEPDIRSLLEMTLGFDGFDVVGYASNGVEAISQASKLQPDLVVLDLSMPVMGGLEALPLVRSGAPACRVVVLSAISGEQIRQRAADAGASAYVEKPEAISRLASTLREICPA